ncbi:MAG: Pr6Pr family membrane protein [Nonomuraea sp.]|nr:Pr6Pr family membrane protein [Nonomuraea sp.]
MRVIWRLLMVLAASAGIVCLAFTIGRPWAYFTVQSNTILVVYCGLRLCGAGRSPTFKGAVTLYLVVTGITNFVSRGGANPLVLLDGDVRHLGNFLLHYVTPVMALADWLAFDRAARPRWSAPFAWPAFPVAYGVFVVTAAPVMLKRYIYPVLPLERLGPAVVVLVVLAVAAIFVVMGYVLIVLHRLAAGPVERSKAAAQWQPPEPQHDPVAWGSRSLPPPSS